MREVADACGVSMSTVSRVINGTPLVAEDKVRAVRAAIERLGFVPNTVARALVGGRTQTIGLLVQHFESPCYALMLRGIEETLSQAGFALVVASGHWHRDEEVQCVQSLRARQVDGLIVLTGQLEDAFLVQLAQALPVVVTGRQLQAPGLHSLVSDDFEGARSATRHLLQQGHTRIAHITGDPGHPDALERERGWRAALHEAGIGSDPALRLAGDYLESGGARAATALLAAGTPFTAIFAANDQMAAGAAQVLHRQGLRVPEDVSIVGFDDLLAAAHAIPPRTTVSLSVGELGRRAASAMLDLLAERQPTATAPAPVLVVRNSTRFVGTGAAA